MKKMKSRQGKWKYGKRKYKTSVLRKIRTENQSRSFVGDLTPPRDVSPLDPTADPTADTEFPSADDELWNRI